MLNVEVITSFSNYIWGEAYLISSKYPELDARTVEQRAWIGSLRKEFQAISYKLASVIGQDNVYCYDDDTDLDTRVLNLAYKAEACFSLKRLIGDTVVTLVSLLRLGHTQARAAKLLGVSKQAVSKECKKVERMLIGQA